MAIIPLYVDGTRLRVDTPSQVVGALSARLTFTEKRFLQGWEKKHAKKLGAPTVEEYDVECFRVDKKGRVCTDAGFLTSIERWLKKEGHTPDVRHIWSADKTRWVFDWNRVRQYYPTMDEDQIQLLEVIIADRWRGGFANLPTGWGKGDIIGALCVGFKRLRIHVIIKGLNALNQRLAPELSSKFVNFGVRCGSKKTNPTARVQLISADSLDGADKNGVDLVLCDEARLLITDSYLRPLSEYDHVVVWGFDATLDKRIDGKNYRREQLFGDVRFKQSFKQAEKKGRVLPVIVVWHRFHMDIDPAASIEDDVEYKRHAFWCNDLRNQKIAQIMNAYNKRGEQCLITTAVLEHALELRKYLPHASLVYGEQKVSDKDVLKYQRRGLLEEDEMIMTWQQAQKNIDRFASGKIMLAIATTVWNYGVSFNKLRRIFYASAIQSYESCNQVSGRLTRKDNGKLQGYHHDMWDCFGNAKRAAKARFRNYAELGYFQVMWNPLKKAYTEFHG